jgi:hypothetical protein
VRLVDANVLLYAVNEDAHHHEDARSWLDRALSGPEPVAFTWVVLLAFLRLSTRAGVFPRPLSVDEAVTTLSSWLARRTAVVVEPGPRHLERLQGLLRDSGSAGNLVNDAHLAAVALELRSVVVSFDRDVGRFDGVRRESPAG